ncbi:MAG TPA: FAD-dependent monooxygenase [Phycisphaerae bacterium]|nr:FAD-dependent monooxygenase [Phycisphaerae bacterium]
MDYDVIVVGAGPAGSCAAKMLADAGAAVALVDAARFPRAKPCAGWLKPPARKPFSAGKPRLSKRVSARCGCGLRAVAV